jgi:hypothetical protein
MQPKIASDYRTSFSDAYLYSTRKIYFVYVHMYMFYMYVGMYERMRINSFYTELKVLRGLRKALELPFLWLQLSGRKQFFDKNIP